MESGKKTDNKTKEQIKKQVEKDLKTPTKNFAKLLKSKRKEQELSMMSLYKLSGVANSTINDIEKERYLPHLEVMLKLGYALGLNYEDIIATYKKNIKTSDDSWRSIITYLKTVLIVHGAKEKDVEEIINFINFKLQNNIPPESFWK